MAKEMIWAYLVHLGECMWRDYGPGDGGRCINTTSLRFHEPTWREITDGLVEKKCCNTIVIDIGEGIQYESHPEIVVEGAWSKQRLAAEISRLRSCLKILRLIGNFAIILLQASFPALTEKPTVSQEKKLTA